jgi:hypothetical protein
MIEYCFWRGVGEFVSYVRFDEKLGGFPETTWRFLEKI